MCFHYLYLYSGILQCTVNLFRNSCDLIRSRSVTYIKAVNLNFEFAYVCVRCTVFPDSRTEQRTGEDLTLALKNVTTWIRANLTQKLNGVYNNNETT